MPRMSNYAGNAIQRFGRYWADRAMPGNQLGSDGTLTNEGRGLAGLAAKVALNALLPGAGALAKPFIAAAVDTGNPFNISGSDSRLGRAAQWLQAMNGGGNPGAVERMPFALDGSVQVPNVGGSMPTFNPVVATSNEGRALPSLGTRNLFAGGSGNFGPAGGREYGQAAGSFTPVGAGVVQVAGQGWGGSDAAAGFGLGAQGAGATSAGQIALADAIAAAKRNLR